METLKQALPDWPLLRCKRGFRWREVCLSDRPLVLFIDDLQEYLPHQSIGVSNHAPVVDSEYTTELEAFLEMRIQTARRVVIVATCRSEAELHTKASRSLDWLLTQLTEIRIPSFDKNTNASEAKQIIDEFQKKGSIYTDDWDGTLGSLVLGLSRKKGQYLALKQGHDLAATILKAMKLLNEARTRVHSERRLRAICSGVFGERELQQDERVWREAVEQLKLRQFVEKDLDEDGSQVLVIRQDTYFEKVVIDYSTSEVKQDFGKLKTVLLELNDVQALIDLGLELCLLKRDKEAITIIDHVLGLKPNRANLWYLRGMVLWRLQQSEEAIEALDQALNLLADKADSQHINERAWFIKGLALYSLQRYQEALIAFDQALVLLDPTDSRAADAWFHKGRAFFVLDRYEEALEAFDQALTIDPKNDHAADVYYPKGLALFYMNRYEEALAAFDQKLAIDPTEGLATDAYYYKGKSLVHMHRYEEALTAFDSALNLAPQMADVLYEKARLLNMLDRYEEAIAACDQALALDSTNTRTLILRSIVQRKMQGFSPEMLRALVWVNVLHIETRDDIRGILRVLAHMDAEELKAAFSGELLYEGARLFVDKCLTVEIKKADDEQDWEGVLALLDEFHHIAQQPGGEPLRAPVTCAKATVVADYMKRPQEALTILQEALPIDDNNARFLLHYTAGCILLNHGTPEAALDRYQQALAESPTTYWFQHFDALQRGSEAAGRIGQWQLRQDLLSEAKRLAESQHQVVAQRMIDWHLAEVAAQKEDYETALPLAIPAIRAFPISSRLGDQQDSAFSTQASLEDFWMSLPGEQRKDFERLICWVTIGPAMTRLLARDAPAEAYPLAITMLESIFQRQRTTNIGCICSMRPDLRLALMLPVKRFMSKSSFYPRAKIVFVSCLL